MRSWNVAMQLFSASYLLFCFVNLLSTDAIAETFTLMIQTSHHELKDEKLHPSAAPVSIQQESEDWQLHAFVKMAPKRGEMLWLDLFWENKATKAQEEIKVQLLEARDEQRSPPDIKVFDYTINPFREDAGQTSFYLGRLNPRGMSRMALGVPYKGENVALSFKIAAEKGEVKTPQASNSIVYSKHFQEVWSVFPDGDHVIVMDGKTDQLVDHLKIEGKPESLCFMGDHDQYVLIAQTKKNQVAVIDRAQRKVIQTLTEADGLGRELRGIVCGSHGIKAYVSGYVSDTVTEIDLQMDAFRVGRSLRLGRRPMGLSLSADGNTLYVAHFLPRGPIVKNEAWVSLVDTQSMAQVGETAFPDPFNMENYECIKHPFDNPEARRVFPNIGEVKPEDVTLEGIMSQLTGVYLEPNGNQAWIPGTRVSGGVETWEVGENPDQSVAELVTFRPGELSSPMILIADSRWQHQLKRQIFDGYIREVNRNYSRCLNAERGFDYTGSFVRETAPNQRVNPLATFPTGMSGITETGNIRHISFSPGGRRAFLLAFTSDEVTVQDALTGHPTSVHHFMLSGSNPMGMVFSESGQKAYVNFENSPWITVLDTSAYADESHLPPPSYVPFEFKHVKDIQYVVGVLGDREDKWLIRHIESIPNEPLIRELQHIRFDHLDPLDPKIRRGKILFNSSNPNKYQMTRSRLGSCAGCHPHGGTDGSAWATMEGERKTISLRGGLADRGWLHISATHKNPKEFLEVVVPERLGGSLDEADEDALVAYLNQGIPKLQAPKVDPRQAAHGRQLFMNYCQACHGDPQQGSGFHEEPRLYNKGTATDNAHVLMGPIFERILPEAPGKLLHSIRGDRAFGDDDWAQKTLDYRPRPPRQKGFFKAPDLTNVYDDAVFLHTGEFSRLEEVVSYVNDYFKFSLSSQEEEAIVSYLKTL